MAEDICQDQGRGRPGTIWLRVCQHSHLADHTLEVLQTRFQMAELGKPVQEVQLEIETIPPKGTCHSCGMVVERLDDTVTCPSWATGPVLWKDDSEMLI